MHHIPILPLSACPHPVLRVDPPMSACCRPWAPWAVEHMHLWASSVGHMLGPACNATALAATGAPLMLLTYEALRADTPNTLARVLQFVGTCGRRAGALLEGSTGSLTAASPDVLRLRT